VLPTVVSTLARYAMLPPGTRVIAAVSGGPDSVCLLHILRDLGCRLVGVAHVNHQLRGAASDEDARFVAGLAQRFALPFHSIAAPVPPEGNLEQSARRARRRFFRDLIAQGLADRIALGHTRDDQAETVLFRILRGSGITGLAGILPITAEGLIRPLLDIRRADVLTYLREHSIPWRDDASNTDPAFARNRIRHTLLPQLSQDWNPRLTQALAQLAEVAYEEEVHWATQLAHLAPSVITPYEGAVELSVPALAKLDPATQRRLLRYAIRLVRGDLTGIGYAHIEDISELLTDPRASGSRPIPGLIAIRSFEWLLLAPPGFPAAPAPLAVGEPGRYVWPAPKPLIHLEIAPPKYRQRPCDTLGLSLEGVELRGWRPGDRYCPVGRTDARKLKELFQQARVPSWRRSRWPILTRKGKILWVKDFGPAAGPSPWQIRELDLPQVQGIHA
jgi:tRNA(Ile)-lysidine synthase